MNITLNPKHIQALRLAGRTTLPDADLDAHLTSAVILLGCLEIGDTIKVVKPQEIWPDGQLKCVDCPGGKMCCAWK